MNQMASKIKNNTLCNLAFVCVAVAYLFTQATTAFAATDTEGTYIDSVYSWGIWELGLEPSSGLQDSANIAMKDRSRELLFRPNDNVAYTPQSIPVPQVQQPLPLPPPTTLPPPAPIVGASGSGSILPGMIPNPPNLR